MSTISGIVKKKAARGVSHLKTGKDGEEIAAKFLQFQGYEIRGKNIRIGRDEIDILAFDPVDHVLVFAEVKTGSKRSREYSPMMNAGHRKCCKLRRSARAWIAKWNFDGGYRLDLICVEARRVTAHLKELSWDEL